MPVLGCAVSAAWLFQFFGNATLGYIHTHSLFYWWSYQWVNPESETQHGLLILALSVWLLVRNLRRDPGTNEAGTPALGWACAAMVAGILVHAVGFVAEQARISIVGLLLYVWGLAAFAGGRRWARAAAFPAAFMLFAVPLNALDSVGFWLRMGVVSASARISHLAGIGVLVNGTQLLSPDGRYDYDVAAACSGVRSLVAVAALALLIGYLRFRPNWLRAAFLVMSFPLILVGNVARIVSIVVAAQVGGQVWGDRAHEIMGYGVFAIVLGGVVAAAATIARFWPRLQVEDPEGGSRPVAGEGAANRAYPGGTWAVAAAAILASVAVSAWLNHVAHLPERGHAGVVLAPDGLAPVELPTFLGTEWIGKASEVTDIERQVLPPDTGFSRKVYVSVADPSNRVFLSIVLSGRDRTSIHRPELCLVGQGWTIDGSMEHQFSRQGPAKAFRATLLQVEKRVVTQKGEARVPQLVAYYFVGGDTIAATHWERIARDAWNRVVHGRADRWAYVLLQTGDSDGSAAAIRRLQEVLDGALPAFQPST